MHIAHYAPSLWSNGGVASYVRRLAETQVARGHEVLLLSHELAPEDRAKMVQSPLADTYTKVADPDRLYDVALIHGVDVLNLHKPVSHRPPSHLPTVRTMHDNTAACPSGTRHLARAGSPCPRLASLPACLWGHVVDGCGSRRPQRIRNNFEQFADETHVLSAVPVIAVSDYVKQEMVRAGYDADTITVVPSPAPTRTDPLPPATTTVPRFLFMGRIVPEKGLDWLLNALALVEEPLHLDVAGDGYALNATRNLCTHLGLDDRVTFHGWVDGDALDALMVDAWALVVPSVWQEPAGLVTLEAAAAGRPVIASRVGGLPEYATEEYAILVAPNDTPALANALTALATDPDRAAQLGTAGRRVAMEQFAMSTFADRLDATYASLVASSDPVPSF